MNVKRRENMPAQPMVRVKNAGSSRGGENQAKPIKNAIAYKPKPTGYAVAKNSVTCIGGD